MVLKAHSLQENSVKHSIPRAPGLFRVGAHTCGPMAIPRGGFILIGPPMLGCPAGTERIAAHDIWSPHLFEVRN